MLDNINVMDIFNANRNIGQVNIYFGPFSTVGQILFCNELGKQNLGNMML